VEVVSVDVEIVVSVVIADDLDARRDVIYSPTATSDWRTAHSEVETIDFSRGATQVDAQEVAFDAQRVQLDWRRVDFDCVAATSEVGKTRLDAREIHIARKLSTEQRATEGKGPN
jgi:hypothetical protein